MPWMSHLTSIFCRRAGRVTTRVASTKNLLESRSTVCPKRERRAAIARAVARAGGSGADSARTPSRPYSARWGWRPRGITTRSAGRGGGLSSRRSTRRRVGAGVGGERSFCLHACWTQSCGVPHGWDKLRAIELARLLSRQDG
eukprot:363806-Chlamydomonas_euryale.AAC.2